MRGAARRRRPLVCLLTGLVALAAPRAVLARTVRLELLAGAAANAPATLAIEQAGQPRLELDARFATRPLKSPPYYAWRIGVDQDRVGWELGFIHHKLYLRGSHPEVRHFEATHGFNLVLVARAARHAVWTWRTGPGVVIAHTESQVRRKTHESTGGVAGYHLAGPALALGAGRSWSPTRRLTLLAEGALTAAWARMEIADGHARTTNLAAHVLVGLGYRFGGP